MSRVWDWIGCLRNEAGSVLIPCFLLLVDLGVGTTAYNCILRLSLYDRNQTNKDK